MKKIVNTVVKEEKKVVAVQITEEEFAELASRECANMFLEMSHEGEQSIVDVLLPMICAKFSAHLMARIFADNNEENEEREEN